MAQNLLDFWYGILRILYETRLMLEKTQSLSNWTTQSVGNRANPYACKAVAKYGNKRIMVSLPVGFQPARQGSGYDNDSVSLAKGKSSDIWSMYANRNVPNPERETLAFLAYCVCQILTGSMTSYENEGKIVFCKAILDNVKFQELVYTMDIESIDGRSQTITYDLKTLTTLIAGLYPCPQRFLNTAKKTGKQAVARLDISEKPATSKVKKPATSKKPAGKKPADNPPESLTV